MTKRVTQDLSEWIHALKWEDLSQTVIDKIVEATINGIGVGLAAVEEKAGQIIVDYVATAAEGEQAPVIGTNVKASYRNAALANGTLMHVHDLDDAHMPATFHPTAVMTPALFALAEKRKCTGKEFITAYAAGLHAAVAIFHALTRTHYQQGWHATGTIGTLCSTVAAAKLMDLSPMEIRTALGIASSKAGTLRSNFGSMVKPYHAGQAAASAVESVLMAALGFTASTNILEEEFGFFHTFSANKTYDLTKFVEWLARPLDDTFNGHFLKQYANCGQAHRPMDVIRRVKEEMELNPDGIEKIVVRVTDFLSHTLIHKRPKTGLEGRFSLEHAVAVMVYDNKGGIHQFTDEKVQEVAPFYEKIYRESDPTIPVEGGDGPEVIIYFKDGSKIARTNPLPEGVPWEPPTTEALRVIYRDCASLLLTPEEVKESLERLVDLQNVDDVKTVLTTVLKG